MNDPPIVKLRSAIERLYSTFSRYSLPEHHLAGCPHCVSDTDHGRLFSAPLRYLGPQEIGRFAFKTMTTWGGVDGFRHFLPRIFELLASDGGGHWIDPEVAFGKFCYANWRTWPDDEQEAVVGFFESLWSNVLDHFPNEFDADACLCCIGQAVDDLTSFLEAWRISESLPSAKHFASFVEHNTSGSKRARSRGWALQNLWWKDRIVPASQVVQWLIDPARTVELERAFFAFGADAADAGELSQALENLVYLQSIDGL